MSGPEVSPGWVTGEGAGGFASADSQVAAECAFSVATIQRQRDKSWPWKRRPRCLTAGCALVKGCLETDRARSRFPRTTSMYLHCPHPAPGGRMWLLFFQVRQCLGDGPPGCGGAPTIPVPPSFLLVSLLCLLHVLPLHG